MYYILYRTSTPSFLLCNEVLHRTFILLQFLLTALNDCGHTRTMCPNSFYEVADSVKFEKKIEKLKCSLGRHMFWFAVYDSSKPTAPRNRGSIPPCSWLLGLGRVNSYVSQGHSAKKRWQKKEFRKTQTGQSCSSSVWQVRFHGTTEWRYFT